MRKFLSLALACTLAFSSAVSVFAADVNIEDLPDPVAVYDFEGETDYDIVSNGSGTVEVVNDMDEEANKGKGNVLKVPASGEGADTEISFKNPFAGMDLSEGTQTVDVRGDNYKADDIGMPEWYDGVVINYWIKTTDDTNSVILNFRNNNRLQYHKDDWRKHLLAVEAKEAYDKAAETGEPIDSRFSLGTCTVYIGEDGVTEYNVYSNGGKYMTYNPDFKDGYTLGGSTNVYKKGSDPEDEDSWVTVTALGSSDFDAFYELDFNTNPNSKVRQGYTNGYLQISLNGSISFTEDDMSGTNLNPNITPSQPNQFNCHNTLNMMGTTDFIDLATSKEDNDTMDWHMVTVVIQNDWIDYYIDGELYDAMADEFTYFGTALSLNAGGKSFNAGFGLRAPFQRGAAARTDYLSGNRAGSLLTEWLSLEGTTFSIGGTNAKANRESNAFPEAVAEFEIDDIAFYNTLLDEDQIYALYEAGTDRINNPVVESDVVIGDVDKNGIIDASDALAVLKHAAKLDILEDTAPAMTNSDDVVDASDALNILKYVAKLIDTLPVE